MSSNQKTLAMISSQDIHCFHESLQSKMRTHAPCGTLTSKHMQIFVPRYVPSLLRNKEHIMWPPWPHLHVILHFSPDSFCAGSAEPHTPGGNAAVERCNEAYDSFSPSHTDAALPLGSGAYSTDLLKRQAQYFKSLCRGRRSTLALTTPSQAQYFRSKHGHITA